MTLFQKHFVDRWSVRIKIARRRYRSATSITTSNSNTPMWLSCTPTWRRGTGSSCSWETFTWTKFSASWFSSCWTEGTVLYSLRGELTRRCAHMLSSTKWVHRRRLVCFRKKSLYSLQGSDVQPVFIAMACKVSDFHRSLEPNTPQENLRGCKCHLGTQKILLWVGSSIATKLSYTIAVSTQSNDVRMKYYGPILTIGNSYRDLCVGGKGLVLSHYHIMGMSRHNSKVVVDIVIHEAHDVASHWRYWWKCERLSGD